MRMFFCFRVVLSALIALTLAAPGAEAGIFPKRKPTVRGRIMNVTATPSPDATVHGILGSILLFGEGDRRPNRQQITVNVTSETKIEGVKLHQKSFAVLASGMAVEVKFKEKLPNTYPVTGTAKSIRILNPSYVR